MTAQPKMRPGLLHELEVHQVELELQNEELRASRRRSANRDGEIRRPLRFCAGGLFHAYDKGVIGEANLTDYMENHPEAIVRGKGK